MNVDLGLLVLRLAIGGVILAHGLIKIGWPISMGMRGMAAVRGAAGFFGGLGFWRRSFGSSSRSWPRSAGACW